MAWDWIAPIATSVVGLAGMAATSFTAYTQQQNQIKMLRLQRSHDQNDSLRAEKKKTYLKFTTTISEVVSSIRDGQLTFTPDRHDKLSIEAQRDIDAALDELQIVAPQWIVTYARAVVARTFLWVTAVRFDKEASLIAYKNLLLARDELMTAMRSDMREEGPEEAAKQIATYRSAFKDSGLDYEETADRVVDAWSRLNGAADQADKTELDKTSDEEDR
jgi:hypothetical protein